MTDQAAIERFQALYAEHHARVYAYAVSRVGRQLADEVVSEVFLVAWRRLADVPAPALPWLLTVARNTACSQFRGSARQRSISAEMRAWVTEAELSEPDVADAVSERLSVLPGGRVTSLEVWVDAHGVVHRLSLTSEQVHKIYPLSAYNVRHKPHGPLIFTVPNKAIAAKLKAKLYKARKSPGVIIRIAPPGSGAPRREMQVNRLTVTFSAIGQPQRITAPAHAIPVYGRG